jgi:hypothetical protein
MFKVARVLNAIEDASDDSFENMSINHKEVRFLYDNIKEVIVNYAITE